MTDSEKNAQKEIATMNECDRLCTKTNMKPYDVVTRTNSHAKTFKDKDGNNIYEFFIQNGLDNHNLSAKDKVTTQDVRSMIADEVRAIKGNTATLLME